MSIYLGFIVLRFFNDCMVFFFFGITICSFNFIQLKDTFCCNRKCNKFVLFVCINNDYTFLH